MAKTQTIPDWKASADEIWAILRETTRKQEETSQQMKETDRKMQETAQQMQETTQQMQKTAQQMKETDRRVGKLTNRFGEMVEYMIVPNLVARFHDLGFEFEKTHRGTEIRDKDNNIFTEVDVFLENGDKVMIVETKAKPSVDDINEHIKRMEKLRKYADLHNDKRKYLGAIAGVVFGESQKTAALKKGFYVIEPSGDTFSIIVPEGKYHPHEW
ncbi:MAG: hypothetical protein LBI85_01440 [Spirochaetaceae bacterium]|jgi:uncharacterized coiled-coil DUF342 family protein|nr:hypothetical protein [Spirochaetaceae bacterium]